MALNIQEHISNLLYHHDCVVVSGLGAFIINNETTRINQTTDYFEPIKKSISFNSKIKKNDGLLANHISDIKKISYEEACVQIAQFSKRSILKMEDGESLHFESIGTLKINATGKIIFTPNEKINYNQPTFGLDAFYFPKISQGSNFLHTQYLSATLILSIFIAMGFFLNKNLSHIKNSSNTASFIQKFENSKFNPSKTINDLNELSGLYNIKIAQIDYDLYQILGTNYHLSTKRCFKMGNEINAQLKIYNEGKIRRRDLCFLNDSQTDYTDCYQIKNVYSQIPTSSKNIVVIDKRGRMKKAILVFEETVLDYDTLINANITTQKNEQKNDNVTSRFLDAVKSLSQNNEIIPPIDTDDHEDSKEKSETIIIKKNDPEKKNNNFNNRSKRICHCRMF